MTGGMIVGGWNYVLAAYGITLAVVVGYAASVVLRLRAAQRQQQEEEQG